MRRWAGTVAAGLAGLAGVILVGACTETPAPPGRETYLQYCAGCHGKGAEGDGPAAAHLPVPPADLTALKLSNGGVFPTEHVMATVYGYPGKHDFQVMPEFGPLLEGPKQIWVSPKGEEVMTPVALLELASYLETLQR
ncbi:MAG: cytochrome c [Paracoccaceae bacterium]